MAEMRIAEPLKPLASVIYLKSIMQAFAGHVLPDIKKKTISVPSIGISCSAISSDPLLTGQAIVSCHIDETWHLQAPQGYGFIIFIRNIS